MRKRVSEGWRSILDRQKREEELEIYRESVIRDEKARHVQNFVNRTSNKMNNLKIEQFARERKEEYAVRLNERRERLKDLLEGEEQVYSKELRSLVETPTQRRARLQLELEEIREERKIEHEKDVQTRLENKWREECDPLRAHISNLLQKEVIKERDQQVKMRKEEKKLEKQEDKYWKIKYVEDAKFEMQIKQEENLENSRKAEQNRNAWTAQIQTNQDRLIRERNERKEEEEYYRRINENRIIEAKKMQEEKTKEQEARRRELDTINQDQMRRKDIERKRDADIDRQYLEKAKLDQLKEEENRMVEMLIAKRRMERDRQIIQKQLMKEKENENEIDLYLMQAQQEEQEKQDSVRRIQEEKRKNLMLDAKGYQLWQMQEKEKTKQETLRQKLSEKEYIHASIQEKNQRDFEEREQRNMKVLHQKSILDNQNELRRQSRYQKQIQEEEEIFKMKSEWTKEEEKIQQEINKPIERFKFRGHR